VNKSAFETQKTLTDRIQMFEIGSYANNSLSMSMDGTISHYNPSASVTLNTEMSIDYNTRMSSFAMEASI
jgi:hypothetical protein